MNFHRITRLLVLSSSFKPRVSRHLFSFLFLSSHLASGSTRSTRPVSALLRQRSLSLLWRTKPPSFDSLSFFLLFFTSFFCPASILDFRATTGPTAVFPLPPSASCAPGSNSRHHEPRRATLPRNISPLPRRSRPGGDESLLVAPVHLALNANRSTLRFRHAATFPVPQEPSFHRLPLFATTAAM